MSVAELGFARGRSRMLADTHRLARAPKRPPPTDGRAEISIERDGQETLSNLLKRAGIELETDLQAAKISIERLATQLEIELSRASPASAEQPRPRGGLALWQAKRIRSYIEDNLGSNMRATDLAAIVQLSTSQFFRTFRKTFGEPPHAYIMRRRILRAQQWMSSSQAPMVQIALDCGMCDQAHFIRVFRRIAGVNPAAWRRQMLRDPSSNSAMPTCGESLGV